MRKLLPTPTPTKKNRKKIINLVQQTVYFRTPKNIFLLYFSITVFDVSEPFHTQIDIVTVIKKSDRQNMNLPKMVPVLKSALNFDFWKVKNDGFSSAKTA